MMCYHCNCKSIMRNFLVNGNVSCYLVMICLISFFKFSFAFSWVSVQTGCDYANSPVEPIEHSQLPTLC